MNQFFAQYRAFLILPDVTRMVFTAFASRMPIGMVALATLMFLRESLGSFSQAGIAVGAYFVTMALFVLLMFTEIPLLYSLFNVDAASFEPLWRID